MPLLNSPGGSTLQWIRVEICCAWQYLSKNVFEIIRTSISDTCSRPYLRNSHSLPALLISLRVECWHFNVRQVLTTPLFQTQGRWRWVEGHRPQILAILPQFLSLDSVTRGYWRSHRIPVLKQYKRCGPVLKNSFSLEPPDQRTAVCITRVDRSMVSWDAMSLQDDIM